MEFKDIKLKKGMTKEEVNELIKDYVLFEDEIYLGASYKHSWKCLKCGEVFKRSFASIRTNLLFDCGCVRYNKIEETYKYKVEKTGEYEYIRSFRKGDTLPNGKVAKSSQYIQIKHKYCCSVYFITLHSLINRGIRCGKCCGSYDRSFAHYIEVELNQPLEKYWDFEKNILNPRFVSVCSNKKAWFKCTKKHYHKSYFSYIKRFKSNIFCPYCCNKKVHIYDSFGYHNFEKVMSWHPDNDISPFKVSRCSGRKFKFICETCGNVFYKRIEDIVLRNQWCPECSMSKGENRIKKWLLENNVKYEYEKKFECLVGLGGNNLSYDFYLPYYNFLIEYQGEQHLKYIKGFHKSKKSFSTQLEHDRRKREYAINNGYGEVLEIWYKNFDNIENILEKQINHSNPTKSGS